MPVVSAFLFPASPLPYLVPDNPVWSPFAAAMKKAGEILEQSNPDVLLVYSNGWFAVLDQLWQTRKHLAGNHVDENWHEYGVLPFDITTDQDYANACIASANQQGIKSKPVDYDEFPIDTGTIVASHFLNPNGKRPFVITSNNLYHGPQETLKIAQTAVSEGEKLGRRIAVVGIGGLSGAFFRHTIDITEDKIADPAADEWNQKLLATIADGSGAAVIDLLPAYAENAKGDMGMKHLYFVLGALGNSYAKADVLHYGPLYGTGGAVISFAP